MTNNPAKRRKPKPLLIVLGCCCILAAVALGLYNRWDADRAAQASQQLTADLTMMLEAGNISHEVTPGVDEGLEEQTVGQEEATVATVSVANYDICGVLSIPAIKIDLAVISEWSYPNLAVSACRYSGAPEEQMIILAHNYRGHFGDLAKLKLGDKVSFKDVEGTLHEYEVTGSEIWAADQLREIISGDTWDLTLFTCTYGRANRVVIRCSRI